MAQRSKRAKYHGQVKRELTLAKRYLREMEAERVKSTTVVLLLLSQVGGAATFEKTYIDDLSRQLPFMGYEFQVNPATEALSVKIVVNEDAMKTAMEQAAERSTDMPNVILTDGEGQ